MAGCDYSCLLNGGEEMGMTDNQYKGFLLNQLKSWKKLLDLAIKAGNTEIQEHAEIEIETLNDMLKF